MCSNDMTIVLDSFFPSNGRETAIYIFFYFLVTVVGRRHKKFDHILAIKTPHTCVF
jgi:hypothetical protein